jgi:hypothetical protein
MARAGHVHGCGGRLCDLANCATACLDSIAHLSDGQDHSTHIPDHGNCPVIVRTLQGMARVRSGQAPAWPLSSDRSVRRGSRVKRDFACTFTRHLSPVLVVLRSQSRLRLEGRARTPSGPSPDLGPARSVHTPAKSCGPGRAASANRGCGVLPCGFHRGDAACRAGSRVVDMRSLGWPCAQGHLWAARELAIMGR